MVSNLGIQLANGGSYHHVHHRVHRGNGILRNAMGSLAGVAGRALLNKIVSAISGSGRRRTYRTIEL